MEKPGETLLEISKEQGLNIAEEEFARFMDNTDEVRHLRSQFYVPRVSELLEEFNDSVLLLNDVNTRGTPLTI